MFDSDQPKRSNRKRVSRLSKIAPVMVPKPNIYLMDVTETESFDNDSGNESDGNPHKTRKVCDEGM